jgi:hypothetical protein
LEHEIEQAKAVAETTTLEMQKAKNPVTRTASNWTGRRFFCFGNFPSEGNPGVR